MRISRFILRRVELAQQVKTGDLNPQNLQNGMRASSCKLSFGFHMHATTHTQTCTQKLVLKKIKCVFLGGRDDSVSKDACCQRYLRT